MRLFDAESIIYDICTACPREEDCVFHVCEITEAIRKAEAEIHDNPELLKGGEG